MVNETIIKDCGGVKMEEFMMRSDIICPECGSKEISIVGNISPYEYFCKCDDCKNEFEAKITSEIFS